MGSCDVCGREVKNYGVFLGGIRCPNHCKERWWMRNDRDSRSGKTSSALSATTTGAAKKVTYNPDGTVNICDHEFDMPENLEYDWE